MGTEEWQWVLDKGVSMYGRQNLSHINGNNIVNAGSSKWYSRLEVCGIVSFQPDELQKDGDRTGETQRRRGRW